MWYVTEHFHIFVGDLSPDIDIQQLREAFICFGQISYVQNAMKHIVFVAADDLLYSRTTGL